MFREGVVVAESGWNAEELKGVRSKECGRRNAASEDRIPISSGTVSDAGSKLTQGRRGVGRGSRGP